MGDRGGTATACPTRNPRLHYTRWEIEGEPQPASARQAQGCIIPDGRSGGNRNRARRRDVAGRIIPDGRSGGNRNYYNGTSAGDALYPMGDRGGTATRASGQACQFDYTRWEIGGEPQPVVHGSGRGRIIPDGRSGGNRNYNAPVRSSTLIIPDGRSGGEPQQSQPV